jgi:tetratricopeptide (TPR) repeat protein
MPPIPMKPLSLLFVMLLAAGCHEAPTPSSALESANPIVPPFASGLIEEPSDEAAAHAGTEGSSAMAVIQQARDRLTQNPKDLDALIFLGNANYDVQRYQEAEELYRRALEIDAENVRVRTDRATALHRLGRSREAVEELQRALVIDYRHENALYNIGMIKLAAFSDRDGAIAAWTQLKEVTQDQQLVARLDAMIAQVRETPPKKVDKPKGSATTGTVLQLPASPKK